MLKWSLLKKKLSLSVQKAEKKIKGLFDSGATYSCISRELAKELEVLIPLAEPLRFETAEKGKELEAKERVALDFHLNGYRFSDEFMVLPELSEEVIIGAKTMQALRFKLDFEKEEVIIDPRVTRLRFG